MRSISYVAWILCALLVAASTDSVPDPPAVKYTYGLDAQALYFGNTVGSFQRQLFNTDFRLSIPEGAVRWIVVTQVDQTSRSNYGMVLTRHAADSSPPIFAA